MINTKLPYSSPEKIRKAVKELEPAFKEAGDTGTNSMSAIIGNTILRSALIDELEKKSKWDWRFKK